VNHYHFYDDGILYRYAEKEVFDMLANQKGCDT